MPPSVQPIAAIATSKKSERAIKGAKKSKPRSLRNESSAGREASVQSRASVVGKKVAAKG